MNDATEEDGVGHIQPREVLKLLVIVALLLGAGWVMAGGHAAAASVYTAPRFSAAPMAAKTPTTSISNPGPGVPFTGGGVTSSQSGSSLPATGGAAGGAPYPAAPFLALGLLLIALGASAYRLRRT